MAQTVFVVDDNSADLRMLCRAIAATRPDLTVRCFSDLADCYGAILEDQPDFVVIDDLLDWMTANDSLKFLRMIGYDGSTIVVSGINIEKRAERLETLGASAYLAKDDIYDEPRVLTRHFDVPPRQERQGLSGSERLKRYLRLYDEIALSR